MPERLGSCFQTHIICQFLNCFPISECIYVRFSKLLTISCPLWYTPPCHGYYESCVVLFLIFLCFTMMNQVIWYILVQHLPKNYVFSLACHLRHVIFYLSAFLIWTAQFFSTVFQYLLVLHGLEGTSIHFILSSFKNELVRKITVVIFLRQCSYAHSS